MPLFEEKLIKALDYGLSYCDIQARDQALLYSVVIWAQNDKMIMGGYNYAFELRLTSNYVWLKKWLETTKINHHVMQMIATIEDEYIAVTLTKRSHDKGLNMVEIKEKVNASQVYP